jgi:hypothetical protein
MATDSSTSELNAFYAFLGQVRQQPGAPISPEESVRRFRESQEQLRRFHEGNALAVSQNVQGLSAPLELEVLLERVEQRVAQQGTPK